MSAEFVREKRFFVLKLKDFAKLPEETKQAFAEIADEVRQKYADLGIPMRECVVVESDWPEYEVVWEMIADRMDPDRKAMTPAEIADHWRTRYLEQKRLAGDSFEKARSTIAECDQLRAERDKALDTVVNLRAQLAGAEAEARVFGQELDRLRSSKEGAA